MTYSEFEPAAALHPFVERLWYLPCFTPAADRSDVVYPDGRVELVIAMHDVAGEGAWPVEISIAGQMDKPDAASAFGGSLLLGVRFGTGTATVRHLSPFKSPTRLWAAR